MFLSNRMTSTEDSTARNKTKITAICSLLFLTSNISDTIDHVKLTDNSARNTKNRHADRLYVAINSTINVNGLEHNSPTPQTCGSIEGTRWRNRCAIKLPNGTPKTPANIDTRPNLNEMLQEKLAVFVFVEKMKNKNKL